MRRALKEDGAFRDALAELTWLESHATTYRYPRTKGGISDPPDRNRLDAALGMSGEVLLGLAEHFEVDLDPLSDKPASRSDSLRRRP